MPHALVEDYITERDGLVTKVNVLKNAALERKGDPTADDLELMTKAHARIDKLDELIKVLGVDKTMDDDERNRLLSMPTGGPPQTMYRNAGELVWDCLHATFGSAHDHDDQDAKRRWDGVMKRAAEHMGTTAAGTTAVAGGVAGLSVQPVVGPVIDLTPSGQPFLSAIGKRPAPNALTFTRPRIVDPSFETGAGPQAAGKEKGELVSKKFDIKVDSLTLATVGGYLNVSQQLLSFEPSAWNIIVNQLSKRTAYQGEKAAIAEMAESASEVPLAAAAAPDVVLAALFDAAAMVYDKTGELPTWIAYGPLGWAMLGKLTDGADRPLFPFLGASNALGSADLGSFGLGPLGLQQIVTHGITTTDLWMGNDLALEAYVYPFPILEAVEPALLGRQVAVAEAMAFYRPTTDETPSPAGNGAVRIGVAA